MTFNNGLWRDGTSGNDTIDLGWQAPWDVRDNADGGAGNDTIWGNVADNHLIGGSGSDYISGSWGDDWIEGGADPDSLFGDEGNDTISGGTGGDWIDGGSGNDTLSGDEGNDTIFGGDGNDQLVGGTGDDHLNGGSGSDLLLDDDESNLLPPFHANGNDVMHGGDGDDGLVSWDGADKLFGDAGNDFIQIYSLDGHNHLADAGLEIHGGTGVDTLSLTADHDIVYQGLGAHTDGIERVAFVDSYNPGTYHSTLNLSFRDVMNASDTDTLAISGDGHDTVNLDSFVANDPLSGGHWTQGITQLTSDPTQTNIVYNYSFNGSVMASVIVENDVHVNLPLAPILTLPDHHL